MEESLRGLILREFPHEEIDIRTYSPGTLAFLGDAVYSLVIRTILVSKGNRQAEKLHNETTFYVRAEQQAAIGIAVYDLLTEEEKKVYRRGRNSNPYHHAKSSSMEEYLQATALETLCGYLYLQDRTERLMELLREAHSGQKRKSKYGFEEDYMVHPLTLACHALALKLRDDEVIAACLAHDMVEDSAGRVTLDRLPEGRVRDAVRRVSKNMYDPNEKDWEDKYYEEIRKDPLACLVKCLDRVNNLAGMADAFSREKMIRYIRETEKYYPDLLKVVRVTDRWNDAWWLLRYQMMTMVEIFKRLL